MSCSRLTFHVRLRSRDSFASVRVRAGAALGCGFTESDAEDLDYAEGWEAFALGLRILLTDNPMMDSGDEKTFILTGGLPRNSLKQWIRAAMEGPVLNISDYILGLLTLAGETGWYVPDMAELRREAGLDEEAS